MTDGHIHIERGDYTLEWIQRFVDKAVDTGLDEIRLLEHNFRFEEFAPMYKDVCEHSGFVADWFGRVSGKAKYGEYLELIERVREREYPVKIKFGLEVCYFGEYLDLTAELTAAGDLISFWGACISRITSPLTISPSIGKVSMLTGYTAAISMIPYRLPEADFSTV